MILSQIVLRITFLIIVTLVISVSLWGCTEKIPPTPNVDLTVEAQVEATRILDDIIAQTVTAYLEKEKKIEATVTANFTATPTVTSTSIPTVTNTPLPTNTPVPTATLVPTTTPVPTATPISFPTPIPTSTPIPTPTPIILPSPIPTPTQIVEISDVIKNVTPSVVKVIRGQSSGSGVLISSDENKKEGLLLTNYHVIDSEGKLTIEIQDNSYPGKIIGYDSGRDLAVISICCSDSFETIKFSNDEDIKIGEKVIVMGFPLGVKTVRASTGIISGNIYSDEKNRQEIHTDAAINPGNSGGPMILMNGSLAGINTYKIHSTSTVNGDVNTEGFGFAVSHITIENILPKLLDGFQGEEAPYIDPLAPDGVYINPTLNYYIEISPGWSINNNVSNPSAINTTLIRNNNETEITVEVTVNTATGYSSIDEYTSDWTLGKVAGSLLWETNNEGNIFRSSKSSLNEITTYNGYEFENSYTFQDKQYKRFTSWFIKNEKRFSVILDLPAEIWITPDNVTNGNTLKSQSLKTYSSFIPS